MTTKQNDSFWVATAPLIFFIVILVYGLFGHSMILGGERLPVEVLVILSMSFSILFLLWRGYSWEHIQKNITIKVGESVPIIMILFAIGVLIGAWIISGTIPMLIYYGISLINPDWIYIFSFLICIIFSLLTGTSWGSAGTIGVVMIGIAQVYHADIFITAGAVVGGSFFGDKLSPLSDTTNIASLATGVDLFDHIRSMMYTTVPSAVIAAIIYIILSPAIQGTNPDAKVEQLSQISETLSGLESLFSFNIFLLLPLLIVIYGSIKKKPIFITLLISAWSAMLLAMIFQSFSFSDIFQSFNKGFSTDMASSADVNSEVLAILNRGGVYNLIEGIVISFLVFAFIGTLQVMDSIKIAIDKIMTKFYKQTHIMLLALTTTILTNLTTSNQYATSFIIGEAFKNKFDKLKIPRKVLSRSIEDAGTMLENLAPWTPSGIFMASTLGVTALEYAPYQFMSIINIIIAYVFAMTGMACFLNDANNKDQKV